MQNLRPDPALIESAAAFSAATLHEAAGQQGALPSAIKPLASNLSICGPAFTVLSPPEDNLWLHRAIYAAQAGDVLIVDTGHAYEAGYWGEIMTHASIQRRLGGVVIDGCVRDGKCLEELGLPVFARGLCIQGTTKNKQAHGGLNCTIRIGKVSIEDGDLVVGDSDGVVVIPRQVIPEVLAKAKERKEKEALAIKDLSAGATTLDIYGLS
ncbi:MAG TPA: RraA family protein [Pyrinomonadaceae bacterium]|nr:RraA family protein [Pyrinomonadaceae bacterium]